MKCEELKKLVIEYTEEANKADPPKLDYAIFEIWPHFELFLEEAFVDYACGICSENNYLPELKIKFQDKEQLEGIMNQGKGGYIKYLDVIEKASSYFFEDNPFIILTEYHEYKTAYSKIVAIRNFIAHKSRNAKDKYINKCFSGDPAKFVEPNAYLNSLEKESSLLNYTYLTTKIIEISELITTGYK